MHATVVLVTEALVICPVEKFGEYFQINPNDSFAIETFSDLGKKDPCGKGRCCQISFKTNLQKGFSNKISV